MNTQTLAEILNVLSELGAKHALIGGLVAVHYGKRRGTKDVDLLVSKRFFGQLKTRLVQRGYIMREFECLMKMYVRGKLDSVADFVEHESNAVLSAAVMAATPAEILGLPVRVVQRGAFVALKFESAISPRRCPKDRLLDVDDIRGVLEKEFGPRDFQLAVEIAGKMYPGAVAHLESLIDDLRRGRLPKMTIRVGTQAGLLLRRGIWPLRGRGFLWRRR